MIQTIPNDYPFVAKLDGLTSCGDQLQARCPAHDDQTASLTISLGDDGKLLLHCHAGCTLDDICGAIEIERRDLFPPNGNGTNGRRGIIATYDYHDADGTLLYQVVRFHPKDFRQRRPDGQGGWAWNLRGTKRVLYRLLELLNADPTTTVYIVEGEKDVERLRSRGLVATTCPQGAGKWAKVDDSTLRGRHVVVLPDNDGPGRQHAEQVAVALHGTAASVKVLSLPGLPAKGDVSDWLNAGGSAEELERLAADCPEWAPGRSAPSTNGHHPSNIGRAGRRYEQTDLGNGQRLSDRHRDRIRYCAVQSKWYHWSGKRWEIDRTAYVVQLAKETVRSMQQEAVEVKDDRERTELLKWALASQSARRLRDMVTLAQSEDGIPILPEEFNADPFLLNCRNGVVDLRTGVLRPHRREDYILQLCDVDYHSDARCDLWEEFLDRIFDGNQELIAYKQRWAGYCLTGSTREHVLEVDYGSGSNGKSTLLGILLELLGDYASKAPPDLLTTGGGDNHPTKRAGLFGKRLVASIETEEGSRLRESLVKELTGGDRISARRMKEDYWEFEPTHKIVLATNHKPQIRGTDHAIWRRVHLVPFTVTIPDDQQDRDLPSKLRGELPGILAWCVRGCLEWQQIGIDPPEIVTEATAEYRSEQDALGNWIDECCVTGSPQFRAKSSELYEVYREWAERSGEYAVNFRRFGIALAERGFERLRSNGIWWLGIGIRNERNERNEFPA